MGKRLLASFLAVAMMLTMAPFAFAADDEVSTQATNTNVAQIGDKQYTSITSAITNSNVGDTIQLLADVSTDTLKSGVTYDLNGHTLTYTSAMTVENTAAPTSFIDASVLGAKRGGTLKMTRTSGGISAFTVSAGATFNAQNIRIESTRCEGIFPQGKGATLNITNCDMKANWYCVGTNAGNLANYGVIINLKGSTFSSVGTLAVDGTAVYINVSGKLNIDDCELTAPRQALMVRAGTANITNSTLKTTGNYGNKEQYYTGNWKTGNEVPAAALVVGNYVDGAANSYVADAVVTVENTELIGENGFPALYVDGNTKYKSDVSISGDETVVSGAVMKGQQTAEDAVNIGISGGTFSSDVSDYCVSGYEPVKGEDGNYTVEDHRVAEVDGVVYTSLADAIAIATNGQTVKLLNDVDLPGNVVINKSITLDLNGKKIYNTTDIWHDADENDENDKNIVAMFDIKNDADVIITGNGTVEAKQNDCYNFNIVKGSLTIENGTFIGNVSAVQVQNGHLAIKGGKFDLLQKWDGSKFLINCIDDAWVDGSATVAISGGTFVNFDPAHGPEKGNPSFCAPGYKTELTNGVYVVKAGTNDAINTIDAAIKDGASEAEIKAAVDAVVSTPNATLANSSTTMDKLAKLEEVYTNANTGITVKVENGTGAEKPDTELQAAKNAALSASAGETVTINVDKNADKQTDAENAIKAATQADAVTVEALDITMKINGTETQPKAPVVLTFELPEGKDNAQIYRIEGNTATKIPTTLNVNAEGKRTISGTFDHFSTYGIQYLNATANENKYTLILQPNTREVSAGDTLTYTVSLRHDAGSDNDTISGLRFNLDANEGLKLNPSASKGFDNTVKFGQTGGNGNYQFNFVGTKTLQTNQTMSVGTLSYTVQDYGNNGDKVTAPVANTTVVTNSGTNVLPSLSVDSGDVTYHEIELTFVQPDGVSSKYYAKYNATGLYETIADMINGTMAEAPTVTDPNSTEYRLIDTNWHAETDMDTIYDINSTKNIMSTTYVTNKQEIVKVTVSDGVTITSTPVTERSGEKYIDKGAELTFTVKNPDAGMKNKVTATIGNGTSEELTPVENGTYTVSGNKITGDVTITVTQELALTAADIKIFKTDSTNGGVQGYLPYSTYSGTRTLVLIKGAAGVNYTLGANQPEIFALPEGAYTTDDGTASYTHAVLMEPTDVVSEEAMLTTLKNAGLWTTADNVTSITYDWKTAGEDALDFQNVTTTYDFKSLTADKFKWDPSDAQLLKADVLNLAGETNVYQEESYQTARDGHVSDEDVAAFMYLYAKLAK